MCFREDVIRMKRTDNTEEKVLVLITTQKSSMRLIDYGAMAARASEAELHILHVQQGNSIFENSILLLQTLMDHAVQMGGEIHILCDDNAAKCIGDFAKTEGMTQVILGEAIPGKGLMEYERILSALPRTVKVIPVPRAYLTEQPAEGKKIV